MSSYYLIFVFLLINHWSTGKDHQAHAQTKDMYNNLDDNKNHFTLFENGRRVVAQIGELEANNSRQNKSLNILEGKKEQTYKMEQRIMSKFVGRYRQNGPAENYDAYLKALGEGYVARQAAKLIRWQTHITQQPDDYWQIKVSSIVMTINAMFKLNVPFDENTSQFKSKSIITLNGEDELVHNQTILDTGAQIVGIRRFEENKFTLITTTKGVSCVFHYIKVE